VVPGCAPSETPVSAPTELPQATATREAEPTATQEPTEEPEPTATAQEPAATATEEALPTATTQPATPTTEPTEGPSEPEGQVLLEERCSACHALARVENSQKTREEWATTVDRMVGYGAQLSDAERSVLLDYLAETYGP